MSFLVRRALRTRKRFLLKGTLSLLAGWTAISLLALPLAGVFFLIPQPVHAQEFNKGVAFYKAGKYREALQQFNLALSKRPSEASIYYYIATCYHQLKDLPHAKSYYIEAINYAGLNAVGQNALKGLQAIDPATAKSIHMQLSGQSGMAPSRKTVASSASGTTRVVSSASSAASQMGELIAPQESRIQVTKQPNGAAVVQAQLNGRSIDMLYDTGAEQCLFGANHLADLGIKPPSGPPTSYSMGIGDGGKQKAWSMRANLRIGQIERRNFPISVQESLPLHPLLGQSFFRDFRYEIDNQASAIRLVRTDSVAQAAARRSSSIYAGATSTSTRDVPFRREGNEIIVDVLVNGRPIPMFFDTGADHITFSSQHLQAVGLRIPEDAEDGVMGGVGGSSKCKMFTVQRMQLGPIIKQDIPISAIEGHSTLPHPLLGQTFFGNWKFAIDNANSVIKFHSASGD